MLFDTQGISYPSTNIALSKSNKTYHHIYRCIRWCLWRTTVTGIWWNRIPNNFSFTYIYGQCKWSTTEQKAYGIYYIVTKCNYYPQGAEVIVCNDHTPLARFLNGKNANNKVHRWELEIVTYNISLEWISGAWNKAAECLSWLVELPQDRPATVQMLSATNLEGPAFNARSRTA